MTDMPLFSKYSKLLYIFNNNSGTIRRILKEIETDADKTQDLLFYQRE